MPHVASARVPVQLRQCRGHNNQNRNFGFCYGSFLYDSATQADNFANYPDADILQFVFSRQCFLLFRGSLGSELGIQIWDFPKIRVPYFGVLMKRILLFMVLF